MHVLEKDVLQCHMSNQKHSFSFIQTTCFCFWTTVSPQYVSVFCSWWALLADKSFRKPSVHFHSSFQQCEWCDSLLGQRDYWDQASPSSMPLAQPAKPAQSVPQAPRCLAEQPTRHTESKEAPGTPLIVYALGSFLASQREEGPQSQGCPTAPHSALTQRFWGRYICFEAFGFWGHPIVQVEIVNFF